MDNIIASKLYQPVLLATFRVGDSGSMSNQLNDILSLAINNIYMDIASDDHHSRSSIM